MHINKINIIFHCYLISISRIKSTLGTLQFIKLCLQSTMSFLSALRLFQFKECFIIPAQYAIQTKNYAGKYIFHRIIMFIYCIGYILFEAEVMFCTFTFFNFFISNLPNALILHRNYVSFNLLIKMLTNQLYRIKLCQLL